MFVYAPMKIITYIRYKVEKLLEKPFHGLEMEKKEISNIRYYLQSTFDTLKYQQVSFFDKYYHLKLTMLNVANKL